MSTRSLAAFALVVACGAPQPPPAAPPVRIAAVAPLPAVMPPVVAPPVISDGPPRAMIEAPSGGAIELAAITPDGKVAITSDELGGVRLWPALDGTLEPRVVDLAEPKELSIVRAPGAGFTVAELDEVGGLVIANLDAEGRTRSHVSFGADPAYAGLASTELGVLAWRTDQTIALIGDDGLIKSKLGTDPGQRLLAVAAQGRQAVAVVETLVGDKLQHRVRHLVLEPQLAWGAEIDVGADVGTDLAVSASGKRLAMIVQSADEKKTISVRVIEVATGKVLANEQAAMQAQLGFVDDDHVAIGAPNGLVWLDVSATTKLSTVASFSQSVPRIAVANGHVLVPAAGELMIATPTDNAYLGYELESTSVAAAAPDGALVVGVGDTFVSLDPALHATTAVDLGLGGGVNVAELHWLAGKDWLVEGTKVADGAVVVSLVGVDGRKPQIMRTGVGLVQLVMTDPSTQLVTLSLGDTPEIDRYDPKRRSIARIGILPKTKGYEQIELIPVSPALADGNQLIRVSMRDQMTMQWLRDPRALGTVASSAKIEGSLAGADAAGHVFAWRNSKAGQLELVTYRGGSETGLLPHDGPVALWPDPRGTRLVEIGQHSIAMYSVDGTLGWTQTVAGATEALWLSDGAIAIISAGGIARLDASTGAVTAVRCGWRFGLSPKAHAPTPRVEPLCAQLRH